MVKLRKKLDEKNILSQGQTYLLKQSLKELLGHGLVDTEAAFSSRFSYRPDPYFLRDALLAELLEKESR